MSPIPKPSEYPDFLLRSTLGISIVTAILVIPLGLFHLFSANWVLAIASLSLGCLCIYNAIRCYHDDYQRQLNLCILTPTIIICSVLSTIFLGTYGAYWAFLGLIGFTFILPLNDGLRVTIFYAILMSLVGLYYLPSDAAARFLMVLFAMSFFVSLALKQVYLQHDLLKQMSITDPLTGVYNRSLLQPSLEKSIDHSKRENSNMSVAMIDIDHFKQVNDNYGHNMGDIVLRNFAILLENHFRNTDLIFRIGGEEFLVILHHADTPSSFDSAERFRQIVENHTFIEGQKITVSIGLSTLKPDMQWSDWVKQSDDNLYLAKSSGRNRVIH